MRKRLNEFSLDFFEKMCYNYFTQNGEVRIKKQNKVMLRNIIIVAVLLLVAWILRSILRKMPSLFLPTVLTTIRNVIHISIAIMWTISLYRRVVNKQVRNLLIAVGSLMTLWLIAKTVKYEVFPNNTTTAGRYL